VILRSFIRWGRKALIETSNRLKNTFDPPVVVLIYHRVTTLREDSQLLAVSPDNFRDHLRYLKGNFPLLRFEDDWSAVAEPSVVVTFDDGYADNALEALPIMEEVGVPATFFISTGTLGTLREFWWDDLERIILAGGPFPACFTLVDGRLNRSWPTAILAERRVLYEDLHQLMKKIEPDRRDMWISQLHDWAGTGAEGRETHRPLTNNELQCLAASRWVTIGAHTVSHAPLATLSRPKQQEEITESKLQLEKLLGKEITVFSYPFGGKCDYTRTSAGLCREAGFVKAAANFPGLAHRWTDPYRIPRRLVRNWPLEMFAENMERFWVS